MASNDIIGDVEPKEKQGIKSKTEDVSTNLGKSFRRSDEEESTGLGRVVASHYNQVEDKGLEVRNQSRIVYMRNFNNWVKSLLIIKFLKEIREHSADEHKIMVLDLGCGKGGDLIKWQKGNIRHLICADIADTTITHCQERYEYFKRRGRIFSAEFIVADCTKARLKNYISCPGMKTDLVSCQFSFHYCFESLLQAETMIQNIADLLKKGGFFFGTIPDSYKIVSHLQEANCMSFGNEVFRIEFPEDRVQDPPLFGDTYNFYLEGVVNCPEFLVYFPTLVRLCKKYGLELVYKKSFEDIYNEGILDRESRGLLFKMKALEIYPSRTDIPPSSTNEEEYAHARDFLVEKNVSSVKTLSKSEWEAICLYIGFAFKKVV